MTVEEMWLSSRYVLAYRTKKKEVREVLDRVNLKEADKNSLRSVGMKKGRYRTAIV
jgi:hypothetical protein